ncbi:addiction module toxin, HicA family protein [Clostridia bacterium]|nr:addiction module toxin, HicA family protein [Clostridia bacterium]
MTTAREVEKEITADGWRHDSQSGSHRHYKHPTKPGKVTTPFHTGKDLKKKTVEGIRKQAGLK